MNEVTQLFVRHLERSPAIQAASELAAALEAAGDDSQAIQAAVFRYMAAVQREFVTFIATIDVVAAAINLQD